MKTLHNQEAVFFGRITASITHEMKNVMAVIRESSGLMGDFLGLPSSEEFEYHDKFQKQVSNIKDQINRGVDLIGLLNRLAHCPDSETADLDLDEQVNLIVSLSQRFARQKKLTLELLPSATPLGTITNPLKLQMALFAGIESCLKILAPGGVIRIQPLENEGKSAVRFECEGELSEAGNFSDQVADLPSWTSLADYAADLGGRIELSDRSAGFLLVLPGR